MTEGSSTSIRLSAISPSLSPAALPAEIAAIGPAPQALVDMDAAARRLDPSLRERIRALARGANAAMRTDPIRAAACWHEAGRLLHRRAGRPAEAWTCHSRALAIHPDYKPARDALRRLARLAGDRDTLSLLIDSQIGRPANPCEIACLLSEQAVLEIEAGRHAEAMDSLRDASAAYREALVPTLLKLGVSVNQLDDIELAECLEALIERWPEPAGAVGLKLILALFEERLGRLDTALSRLDSEDTENLSHAGLWARIRLRLRQDRAPEAEDDLKALAGRVGEPSMRAALLRWRRAIGVLSMAGEPTSTTDELDTTDELADLDLLAALRATSPSLRVGPLTRLAKRATTQRLHAAIAIARDTASWAAGEAPSSLAPDTGPPSPGAGGLAALIGAEFPWEPGSTVLSAEVDPSALLYNSLANRELGQAAGDFAELRERIADSEDRWALAVAEAFVRLHHLEQPELALAALRGEGLASSREPLPSLLRMADRTKLSLGELAEAQADNADSQGEKALHLAWAAHHKETMDKTKARELHERALALDPTCVLALCGLERIGCSADELARVWTAASEAASSSDAVNHLVRAAYWHRLGGAHSRAAALFLRAHKAESLDRGLWEAALKAASTHMRSALSSHVLTPPPGALGVDELGCLGSLALEIAPEQAAAWFDAALEVGDDPILALGRREALFESGQGELVVTALARALPGAKGDDAARLAMRGALAAKRQGVDTAALCLLLEELTRRMPGHRPSNVKLAVLHLQARNLQGCANALRNLAASTSDTALASAAATAAWQLRPSELAFLELASLIDPANCLAHVELEASLLGHAEDARNVALERVLEALPNNASHWLRLAELQRGRGDHLTAAASYQQASATAPGDPIPLLRMMSMTETQDATVDTLIELARRCEAPTHKRELLHAAATAATNDSLDPARAGRLWTDLLEAAPDDDEAFERARSLAQELGDQELICATLKARLRTSLDPETERQLHLEAVNPCLLLHDRGAAKEHLGRAAELMVNDLDAQVRLAGLHRDDGEWHAAIERLMMAARLVRGPEHGIPIFFSLGELYMDHSTRLDLAEKSFLKVLDWDREHSPSLERIAELYHRSGNPGRAAQALEHLIRLSTNPRDRIEKALALSDVLDTELERAEDAERVLIQAWEIDTTDLRPIEGLARLLERRYDTMSLNVFVDRAIAAQLAEPRAVCGDPEALRRVSRLYELRRHTSMTSIANAAYNIARGAPADATEPRWDLGARIADPAYDELVCAKALTTGLRAVLRAAEEPMARALGVSAKQLDIGRGERLGRKEPLVVNVSHVAQLFGVEPPVVYATAEPGLRIYPGSPAALVVSAEVARATEQPLATFVAASVAHSLRHGLGLATVVPGPTLTAALTAALRTVIPTASASPESAGYSPRIAEAMSAKAKAQIQPFALDCLDALEQLDLETLMREAADRVGLLACGSLRDAMRALRVIHGLKEAPLRELPGYGAMLAFCLSKVHLDLREAMGV